jgi:hypothetical protein
MQGVCRVLALAVLSTVPFAGSSAAQDQGVFAACIKMTTNGLRQIATDRDKRFQGKVEDFRARCRGGDKAVSFMGVPWVDWSNYWGTGDAGSKSTASDTGLPFLGGLALFDRN